MRTMAIGLAAGALFVTACSSDGDSASPDSQPATSPAATSATSGAGVDGPLRGIIDAS